MEMLEQVKEILGQPLNSDKENDNETYLIYDLDCYKALEKLRESSLASKLFIIAGPPKGSVDEYYQKSIERMIVTSSRECDLIVDISPGSIISTFVGGETSVVLSVSVRMGRKVVRFITPCSDYDNECDDFCDYDDILFVGGSNNDVGYMSNSSSNRMKSKRSNVFSLRTNNLVSRYTKADSIPQTPVRIPDTKSGNMPVSNLGKRGRMHEKFPVIATKSFGPNTATNTNTLGLTRDTKSKYFTSGKKHTPPRKKIMKPLDVIVSC